MHWNIYSQQVCSLLAVIIIRYYHYNLIGCIVCTNYLSKRFLQSFNSFSSQGVNIEFVHVPNFGGLSEWEDKGGGDNSIQFINFGRVGDKSCKEWHRKIGGWRGG